MKIFSRHKLLAASTLLIPSIAIGSSILPSTLNWQSPSYEASTTQAEKVNLTTTVQPLLVSQRGTEGCRTVCTYDPVTNTSKCSFVCDV